MFQLSDVTKDWIGNLIENPSRRESWREFVLTLHEAAQPGGPLDGWVFHGTSAARAALIVDQGVLTSEAETGDESGGWFWTEATHWGTPKVAAFYAEDLIESFSNPDLELAIVATRREGLDLYGAFAVDGQTVVSPIFSRLDMEEHEARAIWEHSAKDWQACWEAFGSMLVMGDVGPERLVVLTGLEDLANLLEREALTVPAFTG